MAKNIKKGTKRTATTGSGGKRSGLLAGWGVTKYSPSYDGKVKKT